MAQNDTCGPAKGHVLTKLTNVSYNAHGKPLRPVFCALLAGFYTVLGRLGVFRVKWSPFGGLLRASEPFLDLLATIWAYFGGKVYIPGDVGIVCGRFGRVFGSLGVVSFPLFDFWRSKSLVCSAFCEGNGLFREGVVYTINFLYNLWS